MNTPAKRGQVMPGDRSRVGRSKGVVTAGVRSSTTVGSTVMDRGQKGGADKVSWSRVRRGLVTGQPKVQLGVPPGRHVTGVARTKGHPMLGLDNPGQGVV